VHHLATCIALLFLVSLRGLIPIPHLLHLLVLHWHVWRVPLWARVGIVTMLSALEASGGCGVRRRHRPHRRTNWSSLLTLLESGTRSLRGRTLKLLSRHWNCGVRRWNCCCPKFPLGPPKRNGVFCGGVKRGRDAFRNCLELVALLFCSPIPLRLCSKRIAASTSC
jgi:hypothetical protein